MVPDLNNRQIVAGLPVYIVNSWLLGKRIVSIPYASICNPLISNPNDFVKILPQLRKMQKKTRASCIEINAIYNSGLLSSMNLIAHINYKHNYVLLKGSIDDIFFRLFGMAITAFIPSWLTKVIENRLGRNKG